MYIIIRCKCFFLFIGRELTTWSADNCRPIMVCSCAMSSNCVWLQIIFFSCVSEITLFSFLRSLFRKNGRFPKVFLKKQTQMEEQATEVDPEVITTNDNLLCHLIGYNNDLLVLNQWKGALNRKKPSLLSLLKINVRACTYLGGPIWYNALGVGAYLGDGAYLRKDSILYVCFSEVSYRSGTMLDLYIAAIPDKRL